MTRSENVGANTSTAEVLNISPHGVWLLVGAEEYFLDFDLFPWFRTATVEEICEVELWHQDHLFWPRLDVDLDLDRIRHPEKYPLIAGAKTL